MPDLSDLSVINHTGIVYSETYISVPNIVQDVEQMIYLMRRVILKLNLKKYCQMNRF